MRSRLCPGTTSSFNKAWSERRKYYHHLDEYTPLSITLKIHVKHGERANVRLKIERENISPDRLLSNHTVGLGPGHTQSLISFSFLTFIPNISFLTVWLSTFVFHGIINHNYATRTFPVKNLGQLVNIFPHL